MSVTPPLAPVTTLVTTGVTVPADAEQVPLYGYTAPFRRKRSASTSGHGGSGIRKILPAPVNGSTNSGFPYGVLGMLLDDDDVSSPVAAAAASE